MTKIYTDPLYWKDIVRASLCKYLILKVLADKPLHGYALINKIAEQTKEFFRPTQGAVYPILREFMECGCVTMRLCVFRGRERKEYALTAKGRNALQAGATAWRKGIKCLEFR